MNGCNGVFTLPNTNSYTYSHKMWKDYIVANTKFTMKISSIPIIGIDIGTKLGAVAIQRFHSDWKNWKTWKNGKAFSSQGKSQRILNRLEKSGKITQNTGKVREFQKNFIYFVVIFK